MMTFPITFSVIIPYFHNRETIQRALDSVLKQTVKPIEILVIDDGSYDETLTKLIKHYRFHLTQLDHNQGSAIARAKGAQIAIGSHIALLDSDDAWYPNHLEIHRELWRGAGSLVSAIGTNLKAQESTSAYDNYIVLSGGKDKVREVSMLGSMFSNPLWNSATTLKLDSLKSRDYWTDVTPSYTEDYTLLAKFLMNGNIILKSRKVTGEYFLQKESKSRDINAVFEFRIETSLKLLQVLKVNHFLKRFIKFFLRTYLWISYSLQYAKSYQRYQEFLYPQLGNSLLIKTANACLTKSIVWTALRRVVICRAFPSLRRGM